MKRSGPLKRRTPLRRTKMKRGKRKPNPAGSDPAHLRYIRSLPCCACSKFFHEGVEAHHSTVGRGLSQKTSDRETMPLCGGPAGCHAAFHAARGIFAGWSKAARQTWQKRMVAYFANGGQTV